MNLRADRRLFGQNRFVGQSPQTLRCGDGLAYIYLRHTFRLVDYAFHAGIQSTKSRARKAIEIHPMKPRFSIRDLLWLVVVIALVIGWWLDHRAMQARIDALVGPNPFSINAQPVPQPAIKAQTAAGMQEKPQ